MPKNTPKAAKAKATKAKAAPVTDLSPEESAETSLHLQSGVQYHSGEGIDIDTNTAPTGTSGQWPDGHAKPGDGVNVAYKAS